MKSFYEKARFCVVDRNAGSFWILIFLLSILGAGCTALEPGLEEPSVTVTTFKPVVSQGVNPMFEIGIRVVNPNRNRMKLPEMPYQLFINGFEVVKSEANDLPVMPRLSRADFTVIATVNTAEGLQVLNSMPLNEHGMVAYRFLGKLDIGVKVRTIPVDKNGFFAPLPFIEPSP